MNLKLILIILFFVGAFVFSNKNNGKSKFIVWCTTFLWLSVVLESVFYGTQNGGGADTLTYAKMFKDMINVPLSEIGNSFVNRYIHGRSESDIGYSLLVWFISRFSSSYHFFRAVACLLFYIPFSKLLNKYCTSVLEVLFTEVLYLALFHTFAMYGARQLYALGFGLMFFLFYSEKRYKPAVVALLLGVTIHMSSLLVIIPFAFSFLSDKTVKTAHCVTLFLIPVVWIVANPIISYMGNAIGMEKYAAYGEDEMTGGATTYILLSEILSIICFALTNKQCFEDIRFKYLYAMAPAFTFFAPLIASNGTMIRITLYSQIYVTVLLPYLFTNRLGDKSKTYFLAMIVVLCFLMLKGGHYPYEFFWTTDPIDLW